MNRCTLDTNVAVYAFSTSDPKSRRANSVLEEASFASVQLLNEFAHVARRKMRLEWPDVAASVARLRTIISSILTVDAAANERALGLARRYDLSFYDSLMVSVALTGGAQIIYSEDMQHGLVIDDTLRIIDPFRPDVTL